jgi:hypothetical protein
VTSTPLAESSIADVRAARVHHYFASGQHGVGGFAWEVAPRRVCDDLSVSDIRLDHTTKKYASVVAVDLDNVNLICGCRLLADVSDPSK